MPFCNNCGKPLVDNIKFCHNCGAPVRMVPPPPAETTPPAETPPPPPPVESVPAPPPPPVVAPPKAPAAPSKQGKALPKTCLGCGIAALIVLFIIGILCFAGWNYIMHDKMLNKLFGEYLTPEPRSLTYKGKLVTEVAKEQGLPFHDENWTPMIDGMYKNEKMGVGIRFKTQFMKYGSQTGKAEIIDENDNSTREVTIVSCGGCNYAVRENGQDIGFVNVQNDGLKLLVNSGGEIVIMSFSTDR